MCTPPATKGLGQDWGTKCTIDAKRAWKIFYITPGEGSGGGGRPMKARAPALGPLDLRGSCTT